MTASFRPFRARRLCLAALVAISVSFVAAAPSAEAAPVDGSSAACRAAIAKSVSKLANTTMKAFDGCIKAGLKGVTVDCSDHATADLKQAIDAARSKLDDTIAAKCDDTEAAVALGELQRCGPPTGTAISGFGNLPGCLNDMIPESIDSLRNFILNPTFSTATGDIAKCIGAITKNSSKLMKTVQKVKHKVIKAEDALGFDSDYFDPGDPDGKIGDAFVKSLLGISSACENLTNIEWKAVTSCDNNPIDAPICIVTNVLQLADGLVAAAYDLPGVCPAYLDVLVLDGAEGGVVKRSTDIDFGWTGRGHQNDANGYFYQSFNVDCGGATDNDCASCTLAASCDSGNCRCRNDNFLICDEPFGPDADCGGNECDMLFGPPLPVPADGLPLCFVQRIETANGSTSYENGSTSIVAGIRTFVHTGLSHSSPCPTCVEGVCEGGERHGGACISDGLSDLGETSYDCPPTVASNVVGSGLLTSSELSTEDDSFTAMLPCDAPFEASSCHCSACSGDPTIACRSDSVCTGAGAGACATTQPDHGGAPRQPNDCSDSVCSPVPGEPSEGECLADEESFCSGLVRGNGDGLIPCTNNADCDANLPAGDTCILSRNRRCFLDPITSDGAGGPRIGVDSGALASSSCVPPHGGAFLNPNHWFGFPGPVRTNLAVEFYSVCPNGFSLWSPGGAVCN